MRALRSERSASAIPPQGHWCARPDSNRDDLSITRLSTWRVCHSTTSARTLASSTRLFVAPSRPLTPAGFEPAIHGFKPRALPLRHGITGLHRVTAGLSETALAPSLDSRLSGWRYPATPDGGGGGNRTHVLNTPATRSTCLTPRLHNELKRAGPRALRLHVNGSDHRDATPRSDRERTRVTGSTAVRPRPAARNARRFKVAREIYERANTARHALVVVTLQSKPVRPHGFGPFGGHRTHDLAIKSRLLYQLSYEGMEPPDGIEPSSAAYQAAMCAMHTAATLERAPGLEPGSTGWKPEALPLDDARGEV